MRGYRENLFRQDGDIGKTFSGKIKLGASQAATILADVAPGDMIILGDREDVQKELLGIWESAASVWC